MRLTIEFNEGLVGEWFAKILELPEVVTYGGSAKEALVQAQAQALHTVAGMVERGDLAPEPVFAFELDPPQPRRRKSDSGRLPAQG